MKVEQMFDEFNSKLDPQFTVADKELILKFCNDVVEQLHYDNAMDKNL